MEKTNKPNITLYVKTGCAYSAVALKKVEDLGLQIEEKNVADEGVADEMIALGGKKQEPFMVDHDHNVKLYDSTAIANYLEEHYGAGGQTSVDPNAGLHREDNSNVCEACE